jgi:hypothetical protein
MGVIKRMASFIFNLGCYVIETCKLLLHLFNYSLGSAIYLYNLYLYYVWFKFSFRDASPILSASKPDLNFLLLFPKDLSNFLLTSRRLIIFKRWKVIYLFHGRSYPSGPCSDIELFELNDL